MDKRFSLLLAVVCFCVSMAVSQQTSLSAIKSLPQKHTSFYNVAFSGNIDGKIHNASSGVIKYLCEMDATDKYKNHQLTAEERNLLTEYYSYLPEDFKQVLTEKVYAIYVIDGLPYGGMADYAFDDNDNMFCVLYLNAKVFHISLSDWLAERDSSPFKSPNSNKRLTVQCSHEYKGLLHTVLHETSHIYDYFNHVTPYTEPNLREPGVADTDFVSVWDDYFTPEKKYKNRKVSNASFWGFGKKGTIQEAKGILQYLNTSPFSSLYGAKNWADDFAETYTFYYLKKVFAIDYVVTYEENGKAIESYCPTSNQTVARRYSLLTSIK